MTLWKKKNERDGEQMSDPGSGLGKRGWQKKRVGGFHYSDGTVQYLDRDGCHMTLHLPKLIRLQIKNERILLDVNFKIMFFFCSLLLHACYTEHCDILILSWPSKVSIANASSEWEKKSNAYYPAVTWVRCVASKNMRVRGRPTNQAKPFQIIRSRIPDSANDAPSFGLSFSQTLARPGHTIHSMSPSSCEKSPIMLLTQIIHDGVPNK